MKFIDNIQNRHTLFQLFSCLLLLVPIVNIKLHDNVKLSSPSVKLAGLAGWQEAVDGHSILSSLAVQTWYRRLAGCAVDGDCGRLVAGQGTGGRTVGGQEIGWRKGQPVGLFFRTGGVINGWKFWPLIQKLQSKFAIIFGIVKKNINVYLIICFQ